MFKPDSMIGPYTLVRRLGKGAYGVVWLAEKRTAIATTKVAIKIAVDDHIDIEAAQREASVWVSASGHPNVLPIIDADVYNDQIIIVSEYAPDGSLSTWLNNHGGKAPTVDAAIGMISGILAGLEHLHRRGIIHRDLKPDNILLQGDTPRLADFGIARVLKNTSHSTAVSGTPVYMPPEAFDGKRSEQTDIWSAGVILYQLLSGRLPFQGDDMTSLIGSIVNRQPEPLPPNVNGAIGDVIERALQKNASRRYGTVREMRNDVRRIGSQSVDGDHFFTGDDENISFAQTLRSSTQDETERLIPTRVQIQDSTVSASDPPTVDDRKTRRRLVAALSAVVAAAILIGAGVLYFRNSTASPPVHSEAQISNIFRGKTDAWVDRIFLAQVPKGGIKELSADDESAQVWSTAQCMAAVLGSGKDLSRYVPKIKNAFNFIEGGRRSTPAGGWNYYGTSNPYTVTEIAGWVVLAQIVSLDSKTQIWDAAERQEVLKRIARDLDELKLRQDNSGGWRTIRDDQPGFIRTYSSVIALWSMIEARRSPAVFEQIGTRYDDSIRRGLNWFLVTQKRGQGWVQNPNRAGQVAQYDGLTAQVLFVLSRAETIDAFSFIKLEQVYVNAKKELIANRQMAARPVDKDNSSIPDIDIRFGASEFMAEGSTFLWFPWALAELSQLSRDETLSSDDRKAAAALRSDILNSNYDRLENFVETANLMYIVAENLICSSMYLETVPAVSPI